LRTSAQAIAGSAAALQSGVRRLLRQLRPAALDTLGLDAALDELLRDWQRCHRIEVERHGSGAGAVGETVAIAVFRVVQEALTNVARHAGASRVSLALTRRDGGLLVELADNGVGFGAAGAGFGIAGMLERAVELGGELSLVAGIDGGALVRLRLPLPGGAER
jgi:two-component system sensor histidine kinase UhpB